MLQKLHTKVLLKQDLEMLHRFKSVLLLAAFHVLYVLFAQHKRLLWFPWPWPFVMVEQQLL